MSCAEISFNPQMGGLRKLYTSYLLLFKFLKHQKLKLVICLNIVNNIFRKIFCIVYPFKDDGVASCSIVT